MEVRLIEIIRIISGDFKKRILLVWLEGTPVSFNQKGIRKPYCL